MPTAPTMATLSPFRYVQLARYLVQKVINDRKPSKWKGKGKDVLPYVRESLTAFAGASQIGHTQSRPQSSPASTGESSQSGRNLAYSSGSSSSSTSPPDSILSASAAPAESSTASSSTYPGRTPSKPDGPLRPDPDLPPEPSEIYRLMNDERLLIPGGVKPPREVIVLCHGECLSYEPS